VTDDRPDPRQDASDATRRVHAVVHAAARDDRGDFERTRRGFLAPPLSRQILGRFGQAVWDFDSYAFEAETVAPTCPDTVHPSLWRQAQLNNVAGLFEVTPRIFQVRGLDISNVTFIAGDTGWIIIDPLTSTETATAARELVTSVLGEREVRAVIYTHSHTDHFGGILGVVAADAEDRRGVEILAPAGFLEAAVSENVLAGTAMLRRSTYMYGMLLARDAKGHVDTGLGKGLPALPTVNLVAPTREIADTGTEVVLDGVRMIFQVTPGTEAPAEMNIFFPDDRALCMAENCTATLHNLYTLRGAQVRDALSWSKYIDESLELFGNATDLVFASHHWPRWGREDAAAYLASQRDTYRYLHDQTLRLANHGWTMDEIADELRLPAALGDEYFNRDYYGTVNHNVKAVFQRYLGWFDGNPAHLHPYPPVDAAARYVAFMGGADAVLTKARDSYDAGEYRWVVEVVNHVVFADPANAAARDLQANALEQLGYQAESGPWRDFYLTGAQELRSNGTMLAGLTGNALSGQLTRAMSPAMLIDLFGVRLNGPEAAPLHVTLDLLVADVDEEWAVTVRHGAVSAVARRHAHADVVVRCTQSALALLASGHGELAALEADGGVTVSGDRERLVALLACLDAFSFGFEMVLP
jgi:alkyl sulfatase BDS1-like metallo-beta-lactamase superfamily hydrolase